MSEVGHGFTTEESDLFLAGLHTRYNNIITMLQNEVGAKEVQLHKQAQQLQMQAVKIQELSNSLDQNKELVDKIIQGDVPDATRNALSEDPRGSSSREKAGTPRKA